MKNLNRNQQIERLNTLKKLLKKLEELEWCVPVGKEPENNEYNDMNGLHVVEKTLTSDPSKKSYYFMNTPYKSTGEYYNVPKEYGDKIRKEISKIELEYDDRDER